MVYIWVRHQHTPHDFWTWSFGGSVMCARRLPQPRVGARREVRISPCAAVVADVGVSTRRHVVGDGETRMVAALS